MCNDFGKSVAEKCRSGILGGRIHLVRSWGKMMKSAFLSRDHVRLVRSNRVHNTWPFSFNFVFKGSPVCNDSTPSRLPLIESIH